MPFLVEEGLVSLDEKDGIMSKTTSAEISDALLTLLHRKAVSDASLNKRFLSVLSDEHRSGGQQLEALVERIRADAASEETATRFKALGSRLNPGQREALRAEEGTLVASLNVEEVLAELVSYGVVTLEENEFIRTGATYSERAQRLVTTMYRKNRQQFVHFASILKATESYAEMGGRLLGERRGGGGGSDVMGEENDEKYGKKRERGERMV